MFCKLYRKIMNMSGTKDHNKIIITRFCYAPNGTFGMLQYNDFKSFTVEPPWKDNMPFISCIPDGEYIAKWHRSPKFGPTLAVEGGTVSIFQSSEHDRSHIVFHLGNWPRNFEGCIGLGRKFKCVSGDIGVSSSMVTVKEFLELANEEDNIPLIIKATEGAKL